MEEIVIKSFTDADIKNKLIRAFNKCDKLMGATVIFSGTINNSVRNKYKIDEDDQVDIRKLCKIVGLSHLYNNKFNELWGDLNISRDKNIEDFDIDILDNYDYEFYQDDFGDVDGIVIKFYKEDRDCSDLIIPLISHPSITDDLTMAIPHPDTSLVIEGVKCEKLNKYKLENKHYLLTYKELLITIPDYNKSIMNMIKYN